MEAYYSISNRDLALYNKDTGECIIILTHFNINDVMEKYKIRDADIHIAF